jgi:hypothetical protein
MIGPGTASQPVQQIHTENLLPEFIQILMSPQAKLIGSSKPTGVISRVMVSPYKITAC